MGVYINMEMPKSCRDCRFCNGQADTGYGVCAWCEVDGKARDAYTMQDCPLVPVPPHGRLIDADALMHEFEKAQRTMEQHGQEYSCSFMSNSRELSTEWYCVEDMLENAPTIIEAEEGE